MKRMPSWAAVVLVALTAGSLSTGCVSKKLFRSNAEGTDTRIGGVESAIEENEKRVENMRSETDQRIRALDSDVEAAREVGQSALSTARTAAEKAEMAAKGRLLWTVTLTDEAVKFSFDQATIPDAARAELDGLVSKVKSFGKAVYVEIEGHTDNTGGEDYNLALGQKRADAVRNYLHREGGIPLHAMNTISFGESQPIAGNSNQAGRSQNRRVVIRVLE